MRRGRKTAKVAMAGRLAIRLFWMMRQGWNYQQWSFVGVIKRERGIVMLHLASQAVRDTF